MKQATLTGITTIALLCAATSFAATNCQDFLANNAYDCSFVANGDFLFSDCFEFTSPGSISSKFDLRESIHGLTLGCSCAPSGGVANPEFDGSKSFDCIGNFASTQLHFAGRVHGEKISRGHFTQGDGQTGVFRCRKRSSGC